MITAGKVNAIGVAAKVRSPQLPNVPTLTEQGYPDLDFSNWVGVIAAAGLPAPITDKIHAAVLKAAAAPRVRERLVGAGFEVGMDSSPSQLAQSVKAEFERNAAIVKTFDIKLSQ
jgi:tripartite-type tricarboxylate transporter receptor subunit TctC